MKKLLFAVLCVAATLSAAAQGTIKFQNDAGSLVTDENGAALSSDAGVLAQLQTADGTNIGDPVPIGTPVAGAIVGGILTVEGVAAGASVDLVVYASNADATLTGMSAPFAVTLGSPASGLTPAQPAALGMPGFQVTPIPEPSIVVLAALGGAALLLRRRRK